MTNVCIHLENEPVFQPDGPDTPTFGSFEVAKCATFTASSEAAFLYVQLQVSTDESIRNSTRYRIYSRDGGIGGQQGLIHS